MGATLQDMSVVLYQLVLYGRCNTMTPCVPIIIMFSHTMVPTARHDASNIRKVYFGENHTLLVDEIRIKFHCVDPMMGVPKALLTG